MGVPWHCVSALRLFVYFCFAFHFILPFSLFLSSLVLSLSCSIASGVFSSTYLVLFRMSLMLHESFSIGSDALQERSHMHVVCLLTQFQMHTCAFSVFRTIRKEYDINAKKEYVHLALTITNHNNITTCSSSNTNEATKIVCGFPKIITCKCKNIKLLVLKC